MPGSTQRIYNPSQNTASQTRTIKRLSRLHIRMFRRRAELGSLVAHRAEHHTALFDPQAWATIIADIVVFSRRGLDYFTFADLAEKVGIQIDEATAMRAIRRTSAIMERKGRFYRPINATVAGRLLDVTTEEKLLLGLRTFHGVDEVAAERKSRLADDRRRRDRERKRRARAAKGAVQRPVYEAQSNSAREPWAEFGYSRRTWYRKGCPMPGTSVSTHNLRNRTVGGRTCATPQEPIAQGAEQNRPAPPIRRRRSAGRFVMLEKSSKRKSGAFDVVYLKLGIDVEFARTARFQKLISSAVIRSDAHCLANVSRNANNMKLAATT